MINTHGIPRVLPTPSPRVYAPDAEKKAETKKDVEQTLMEFPSPLQIINDEAVCPTPTAIGWKNRLKD